MLETVSDPKLIARIESKRETPAGTFAGILLDRFYDQHILELGGTVRDSVLEEWYGRPFSIRDWDYIVDDSKKPVNLVKRVEGLPGELTVNSFGNPRWRIAGFEFDVTKLSSNGSKNLENFWSDCDFNLGTIAYCPGHRKILSLSALEGIRKREIDLMTPSRTRPEATLVRALGYEYRLGFTLSEKTKQYIRQTYKPEMDAVINQYLSYKKTPEETRSYITNRLREIVS